MREIKRGEAIVNIHPQDELGKVRDCGVDTTCDRICLAPDPKFEYRVGMWIIKVVKGECCDEQLLIPTKITSIEDCCRVHVTDNSPPSLGGRWVMGTDIIVPIRRRGDKIYIGCEMETVLTVDEYKERYGVDELPEDESGFGWCENCSRPGPTKRTEDDVELCDECYTELVNEQSIDDGVACGGEKTCPADYAGEYDGCFDWLAEMGSWDEAIDGLRGCIENCDRRHEGRLIDAAESLLLEFQDKKETRKTNWPSPEDIEECCGVWLDMEADGMPNGNRVRITEHCLNDYSSRSDFEQNVGLNGFTRIEPIPEQCVPGYEPPKRETPEWMREAVARYPH